MKLIIGTYELDRNFNNYKQKKGDISFDTEDEIFYVISYRTGEPEIFKSVKELFEYFLIDKIINVEFSNKNLTLISAFANFSFNNNKYSRAVFIYMMNKLIQNK